jgi:THO complex subunit 4
LALLYDRAGRSEGIAYVTYNNEGDAQRAINEYDGANANGQPIRISLVPRTGAANVAQPRSLFERIRSPGNGNPRRARSADERVRGPTRRPTPPGIDRYVPPERRRERERSERTTTGPRPAGGLRDRGGRGRGGSGGRRDDNGRRDGNGTLSGGGGSARPRKTVEELDAEMNDYFGTAEEAGETNGAADSGVVNAFAAPAVDEDADMIL